MFPLYRILHRSLSCISNKLHRATAGKPITETTAMNVSYLDLFLAFLGMTFGLVSALPGLFFQPMVEADRPATIDQRKSFVRNS